MRSLNENTLPEQHAQRLAELTAEVVELSRRLGLLEGDRGNRALAQQTVLTIHSYEDDQDAIQFLTENGFVIVRPWEAKNALSPAEGAFRFQVQDPEGSEREISVEISKQLLQETVLRTRGRIEVSSQFWICCAERRLANYLMEHDGFPPANEMVLETLDREDFLLSIRWEKSD
jgi:hypothetical protein